MTRYVSIAALAAIVFAMGVGSSYAGKTWKVREVHVLRTLWIGSLSPLPKDPSNEVGDAPGAVKLGHRIFFDKRFSGDGTIACATCHQPARGFTDGVSVAKGMGTTTRNSPTIIGTAYNPWFFWDGRTDSQWSQALQPLESPKEHGGTRTGFAKIVFGDPDYRSAYEGLFGVMSDVSDNDRFPPGAAPINDTPAHPAWDAMTAADRKTVTGIFVNLGKAIAAYERLLLPGTSRFDQYVDFLLKNGDTPENNILTDKEVAGLALFIRKGRCIQCHNGPLMSNGEFHNTGLSLEEKTPDDEGRARGARAVRESKFNCLGPYSDAGEKECLELDFIKFEGPDLLGSFKTPTLRNVGLTAPYMHDGQFATLLEVLDHYNQAPGSPLGITDIKPLEFTPEQLDQLRQFLLTLESPVRVLPEYLSPPYAGTTNTSNRSVDTPH